MPEASDAQRRASTTARGKAKATSATEAMAKAQPTAIEGAPTRKKVAAVAKRVVEGDITDTSAETPNGNYDSGAKDAEEFDLEAAPDAMIFQEDARDGNGSEAGQVLPQTTATPGLTQHNLQSISSGVCIEL